MIFNYEENEQIKNIKGNIKYYKQIKPFVNGIILDGLISIKELGNNLIFFSKNTKICLGISNKITEKLFEEV